MTTYEHPMWCDVLNCTPHSDAGGEHRSVGTVLPLGAAHVTAQLSYSDDIDHRTGKNVADTRLLLTIEDVEVLNSRSDVALDPNEARLLAAVLNRYADKCQRDNEGRRFTMPASAFQDWQGNALVEGVTR